MPKRRAPDAPLERYQTKRDFSVTPEPHGAGQRPPSVGTRFVVQRHRARRLHYDFRLEIDGVLVSWALPKGPTLDPATRNLAVHVEDHPLDYADFEGVIPKGQYGGGDVIVWDRGTWSSPGHDVSADLARGELHVELEGQKLRGRFMLIHTRRPGRDENQWLLFHKDDDHAVAGWDPEAHPRSVVSGLTNDEVAGAPAAPPARWQPPTAEELAALEALGAKGSWELQGQTVALTNLDKQLFPGRDGEPPVTKGELVRYYATVAPTMLRYLEGRPVNLNRFPNGSASPGFWHKAVPSHAPQWLTRWRNPGARQGESEYYFVIDSVPALAWMANYAAVELHPWTSTAEDPASPTWAYIDIDPGANTSYEEVVVLARLYRTALDHLGVLSVPKLTGRRGVHVWVPVAGGYSFDDTRIWVEKVSRAVGATVPDLVSWTWTKRERQGLARLDYTQNARNKTLVAPYSVRAAPGAPVSAPVTWDELDSDLRPDSFGLRSVSERIGLVGDPMAHLVGMQQRLPDL